jgi:hypothetical protein
LFDDFGTDSNPDFTGVRLADAIDFTPRVGNRIVG